MRVTCSITPPYKRRRRMERERAAFLAALRASLVPESARDVVFASHAPKSGAPLKCGVSLGVGGVHATSTRIKDSRECGQ